MLQLCNHLNERTLQSRRSIVQHIHLQQSGDGVVVQQRECVCSKTLAMYFVVRRALKLFTSSYICQARDHAAQTCKYSCLRAGGKATEDVDKTVARVSWSNETSAASTPSMDVPDIMPTYNKLMRESVEHVFVRIGRIQERRFHCAASPAHSLTRPSPDLQTENQ
jgi:hypothetical protein